MECNSKMKFIDKCKAYETFILPNGQPDWSCTVKPTIRYGRTTICTNGHKESCGSSKPIKSFKRFKNKGICNRVVFNKGGK